MNYEAMVHFTIRIQLYFINELQNKLLGNRLPNF